MSTGAPAIVLASASAVRARLLREAGIAFRVDAAGLDERAVRDALSGDGAAGPADMAEVLARAKAETVSARHEGALVIGADQVLALDGEIFEKPPDMAAARRTLLALAGKSHQLHAGVAVARDGDTLWAHVGTATLTMRRFGPAFVGRYLAQVGEDVLGSVGAYQLESLGVHLFSRIEGDYFTILGLPLLPLLDVLRRQGAVEP